MDHHPPTPTPTPSWSERHPETVDVGVALLALVLDLLLGSATAAFLRGDQPWMTALVPVASAALLVRRRLPVTTLALVVVCAALAVTSAHPHPLVSVMVALATVAQDRRARWAWTCAGAAVTVVTLVALGLEAPLLYAVEVAVGVLLALVTGVWVGTRRRYLRALLELADRLAVERDQQAELAGAAERARIAREMHDIVAHGLSVMIRLADGAAAMSAAAPDRAAEASRLVAETGRTSLADLRRTLGVLRGDESVEHAPQPGVEDIPALVERYRQAGLPVEFRRRGPDTVVGPGTALVVHRAVQESLTNVLRYAIAPSRVLVELDLSGVGVVLTVTDDGAAGPSGTPRTVDVGAGRGILGMRERAAMYGGTVEVGRLPSVGWRTRITLPSATTSREDLPA
ncbi:sensor histidine kinase [Curtobacterium sp. Leaf261]|uniref:sensor histidine kinase n=1 Tax=Curtobacterium sp. Leaf261 TaxID=1736311 RepID=UPI0006FF1C24|nr:histidine kinase [Curtobacterium sp. Leaf261]KQO61386.1 hypothetical protein ASF23_12985 [Curtobacterium sp. Leaf261]